MANSRNWCTVVVAPPNVRVAIGQALRRAFLIDAPTRSHQGLGGLVERLEREVADDPAASI